MNLRVLALLTLLAVPHIGAAQPKAKPRLDAHGFPLPEGAFARIGDLHYAQYDPIRRLAVSPDGKWVASAGAARDVPASLPVREVYAVTIYDAKTGRPVREFRSPSEINSLAFSPSSKLVLIGARYAVVIGELATGRTEIWPPDGEKRENDDGASSPQLLDDERVVVYYQRSPVCIRAWDRTTGKLVCDWRAEGGKVAGLKLAGAGIDALSAALSPSGRTMAWCVRTRPASFEHGNEDATNDLFTFDTLTGKPKDAMRGIDARMGAVVLLDEGETILYTHHVKDEVEVRADGRSYKTNYVSVAVDVKTGKDRFRLPGNATVHAIYPDGKSIYMTSSIISGIARREVATGKNLGWLDVARSYAFAPAPDGKRVVTADQARWFWADLAGKPLHAMTEIPHSMPGVAFESNRRLHVSGPGEPKRIWDIDAGKFVGTREMPYSPTICPQYKLEVRDTNGLGVYDLEAKRELCRLDGINETYPSTSGARFSADSARLLYTRPSHLDPLIRWFDSRTGKELGRHHFVPDPKEPKRWYSNPMWTMPDGSAFGYLTWDHRFMLVDAGTGKVRAVLGESRPKNKVIYHDPEWEIEARPGGFLLATQRFNEKNGRYGECQYTMYSAATGAIVRHYFRDAELRYYPPDHRFFMVHSSRAGDLTIIETATGRPRGIIRTQAGALFYIYFSPDGKTMALNSPDTTVLLFDLNRSWSGKPDLPLPKTAKEAEPLWDRLGDEDPAEAERAIWALARAPLPAITMLKERLKPVREPDADRLRMLVRQLGSSEFKIRDAAAKELLGMHEAILPTLRAARDAASSLEAKRRLEAVIEQVHSERVIRSLRELRALEVVERLGTDDSRKLLHAIAAGLEGAVVTAEAQVILARRRTSP